MDKKEQARKELAEVMRHAEMLKAIIDEPEPDPRLAWIGKWGFFNYNDPECPDNGVMRRLQGIDPGHGGCDFVAGEVRLRYFRPATLEELGVPTAIEPDWSKAPEWARYWAMDESGGAWWYEKEPEFKGDDGTWLGYGRVRHDIICTAWRDSLHKRPEATK